jgi:Domain of unknown function (DUF4833)
MSKTLQALFGIACLAGAMHAQERAQAAIPGLTMAPLFAISWNLTANYVQYDAKLQNGKLDPKEPVKAYWIMKQTDGHHEELTILERLKGYGFSVRPGSEPNTLDLVVVSVKKKTLHIARNGDQFEVTLNIGNCESARLTRAHVQAHKWGLLPVGEYVDLTGVDVKTGEECQERVMHE